MHINKEYIVNPCDKANMITEAFGIDAGYVRKICDIDIPDEWDILYITGESGSGKSTIANEMFKNYTAEKVPDTKNYNENNVDWIMDADIKANVPKLPDELSWLNEE